MREVARRSGCTHQAPYHYFANREAILAALVREGFEDLADHLSAAHDGLEAQGLHATLIASGHAYVEFALRNPGVFRVMFRPDMCDPEHFPEVEHASARARDELARLVRMVAGEGAAPEVETLFWAGVHGLAALLLDGPLAGASRVRSSGRPGRCSTRRVRAAAVRRGAGLGAVARAARRRSERSTSEAPHHCGAGPHAPGDGFRVPARR